MDKVPLLWNGSVVGEMTVVREVSHTCFSVCCPLREEGLRCVWAVGERGELRLGVLEAVGGKAVLERRFSARMTEPVGRVLRGEVRAVGACANTRWQRASHPEELFRTPWIRHQLCGAKGVLFEKTQGAFCLAVPYDPKEPFPLPALFCFAEICHIRERQYAVYRFDRCEHPVFREKN